MTLQKTSIIFRIENEIIKRNVKGKDREINELNIWVDIKKSYPISKKI
jgi:hypothetical protein